MNAHLGLILTYSAALIGLGVWVGRRVTGSDDFFVAGRRLGPGLLFTTMLAANIGAGSTVGATGLGFRDGLSAWWWVGSAGIGSLILAWSVGPSIWRIAKAHDLRTVGDFLEWRYHRNVRGIVAALLWIGTLAILAGQLIALAWVLEVVAGVPKTFGCVIGGIVMTSYFVAGGLLSSAWVNLVQLGVLIVGLGATLPVVLSRAGGWTAVLMQAPHDGYTNLLSGGESGLAYVAMLVPAFVVSPGLLQKIYGARDEGAVRRGVACNGVALLLFALVPVLFGMAARALHPELSNHELALPTVLVQDVPLLLGSLGLAAVFSAEISSADALLFMLATSLSQDLYKGFVNPDATDRRVLAVARAAAIGGGGAGVAIAIVAPSIIDALAVFYTLLSVSLLVPIVAGLYLERVGTPEAVAAIFGGVGLVLLARLDVVSIDVTGWSPALAGLIGAAAGAILVRAIIAHRSHH